MRQDKKVERGRLTFILAKAIGESFIAKDIAEAAVRDFLSDELRAEIIRLARCPSNRTCITQH